MYVVCDGKMLTVTAAAAKKKVMYFVCGAKDIHFLSKKLENHVTWQTTSSLSSSLR